MTNIFSILKNLYTNKSSGWILDIEDKYIQPFLIQRWLIMNVKLRSEVRWLDKYIFSLKPKQYLSLAWSCIPKQEKMPYIKYIKKEKKIDTVGFLMEKVKKYFQDDDNNWYYNEPIVRTAVNKNMAQWFKFFGIKKYYWNKFKLDFDKMKGVGM